MVTTYYPPHHFGGDAIYVYRLAEALAQQGHRVDVAHSLDAYRLQHSEEPETAFPHHPNVTRYALSSRTPRLATLFSHQSGGPGVYARRLQDLMNGKRYDVIHYHNISLLGGPKILQMGQAVKLYTAHEYWLICPTHMLYAFNRQVCEKKQCVPCTLLHKRPPQVWRYANLLERCADSVDCFLMPSRFALERHREDGLKAKMIHLPHFVSPPLDFEDRSDAPALPDRPFFLYAGRLEKLKGVQDLLRIFAHYRKADLLIAGAGTYSRALKRQARSLPHVSFLGQVSPRILGKLYREAVAVLVPSLFYETFGLVAAEPLSYGTPSIVRRIGALTEIIERSGGGLLFSSREECVRAMESIRTQPEVRANLGQRGLAAVHKHWSAEAHLRPYLSLIESLQRDRQTGRRQEASPLQTG